MSDEQKTFEEERIEELKIARRENQHRYIVADEIDRQVQREGNITYFFRKDFLYGKGAKEYSLILLYSKEVEG